MSVTGEAPVRFHRLSFVPDNDECVVGRVDTGTYVTLPADGAALLRRMTVGSSPHDAATWYESTFGEPVDIDDFLDTLRDFGFVRADSDADGDMADRDEAPVRLRWLGRAVFSPIAMACYACLFLVTVVVMLAQPSLLPRPGQVFFTGSLVVVQLVITLGQIPLLGLHEYFHVLAGRRLGLPSQLAVSNRLIDIVFETRMNSLMSVPRRQRYLPFLAGMLCDATGCCVLWLVAAALRQPDGAMPLAGRVALALAFTGVLRLAWQFQLYLRTDLYYVFATAMNCYDLHDASMALVRNRMWRLLRRPGRVADLSGWTERDLRVGRWYGPFIVLGVATLLLVTAFASVPILLRYVEIIAARLHAGWLDAGFWDAAVSTILNILNITALVYLARRKRRRAASGAAS